MSISDGHNYITSTLTTRRFLSPLDRARMRRADEAARHNYLVAWMRRDSVAIQEANEAIEKSVETPENTVE